MSVARGCPVMPTWSAVALLAGLATSARAEPVARTYPQAMADGARQMAAKDVRAAAASFQAALDARPDDPRALAELSWASLLAGDFAAAKRAAGLGMRAPDRTIARLPAGSLTSFSPAR